MIEILRPILIEVANNLLIFVVIFIPVSNMTVLLHEYGHKLAFRYYGFSSNITVNFKNGSGVCIPEPNVMAYFLLFDRRKNFVITVFGPGSVFIFHTVLFLLTGFWFIIPFILWETYEVIDEVMAADKEKHAQRHGGSVCKFWYLESSDEHKLFGDELAKYKYDGIHVPYVKTIYKANGWDIESIIKGY